MSNCLACGLPFSHDEAACPFCGASSQGATTYTFLVNGDNFSLISGTTTVAEATRNEEVHQIKRPANLASEAFLLTSTLKHRFMVVVLDKTLEPVVQIAFSHKKSQPFCVSGLIETRTRDYALAIRSEEGIGLRLVRPDGRLVMLASPRDRDIAQGLDMIVTNPDLELLPLGYFAMVAGTYLAHSAYTSGQLEIPEPERIGQSE